MATAAPGAKTERPGWIVTMPSTALSTEMAGVSVPSLSSKAAPNATTNITPMPTVFGARDDLSRAKRAKTPPCPL